MLFPDPWPKTRHHKRRFVQRDTLDMLARLMKPGSELRLATDDPSYLPWMVEHACTHPAFDLAGRAAGRLARPARRLAADPLRAEEDRRHDNARRFLRLSGVVLDQHLRTLHSVGSTADHDGADHSTRIAAAACSTRQTISDVR